MTSPPTIVYVQHHDDVAPPTHHHTPLLRPTARHLICKKHYTQQSNFFFNLHCAGLWKLSSPPRTEPGLCQ